MPTMKPFQVLLAVVVLACASVVARADVEIIALKYRNAEQVLPILRPLVEPGGALTGMQNQIVVRASAATDTISYRDVGTGFQVVPQLSGERVTLAINPQRDSPGPGGTVNVQRAPTTISGRLGEWIALGGIEISDMRSGSGILSSSNAQRSDNRGIWVKVEELK